MSHLMIMIGKSGKKTKLLSFKNMNNNSNLIVLFDSPSDFDDLDKMISKKGKLTYGGKLSLGAGTKSYNIKGFGEHTSKSHISGGGTKFGIEGKAGVFSGSVGYNIKTKQPEFKLGFNI